MNRTVVREAVSGTLGIVVFGTLLGVAHAPLAVAGALAVVAYGGGRLLFHDPDASRREREEEERVAFIEKGMAQGRELVALAEYVRDVALRERVRHMGERFLQICEEVRGHPEKSWDVSSFVDIYMPRVVTVIRNYVRLTSRPGVDLDGDDLRQAVDTINEIADVLKEMHHRLFRDEVAQLGVASETLRRVLEISEPELTRYRKENQP